ncbi:MAG: hypothetical protein FWE23_04255 [Chitinivibrionia bacterium]|nr:hypothetical protein [Chitinivibrionia bacterium]
MKFWSKGRREHLAAWFNVLSGGAFVGGVMFNVLGAGQDLYLAGVGLALVLFFFLLGFILKGGE